MVIEYPFMDQWSSGYRASLYGAMVQWLGRWISNAGVRVSKTMGGSKVDSAFHPSKVD